MRHKERRTPAQRVAVDEKSNEIPAVRELLKAFASLASAVVAIDAMHTQHDTAQLIIGKGAAAMAGATRSTPSGAGC
jgi:predicted transposase YbfD/YdcC